MDKLAMPEPALSAQDLSQRSYFAKNARPDAAGRLDFTKPARAITTLVRALDHGDYWNPLTCPKIESGGRVWLVGKGRSPHCATPMARPPRRAKLPRWATFCPRPTRKPLKPCLRR